MRERERERRERERKKTKMRKKMFYLRRHTFLLTGIGYLRGREL